MTETEYRLKFPLSEVVFNSTELTFSINHIKSRLTSTLYFLMRFFDKNKNKLYTYTSPRWVIDTEWNRRYRTFNISEELLEKTTYYEIELRAVGITSENPLYFTECMLNEGGDIDYHIPNEQIQADIGFLNSRYVNLYDANDNFLQVIRPQGDAMRTDKLTASTCTVLAPHLANESDIDDPINIFMEFINQREQRIDVLR